MCSPAWISQTINNDVIMEVCVSAVILSRNERPSTLTHRQENYHFKTETSAYTSANSRSFYVSTERIKLK